MAVAAAVLLVGLLSAEFYARFTQEYVSGDFFVYWHATRALLVQGRDPYSLAVTEETHRELPLIEVPPPGSYLFYPEYAFVNPLYAVLPLALLVWLPLDAAESIWLATLFVLLLGSGLLALHNLRIRLQPGTLALAALWIIFFYPTTHSLLNGQFSSIVFACIVGAWWAVKSRHQGLAGALLAGSTIKPQMVLLLLPLTLVWATERRQYRLLLGFALTLGLLLASAFALDASWLNGLIGNLRYHSSDFFSPSPLQLLVSSGAAAELITGALLILYGLAVWRSARRGWENMAALAMGAILLTSVIVVHASTHDQVMLMLPILAGLKWRTDCGHPRLRAFIVLTFFLALPWAISLETKQGHLESLISLLPLGIGVPAWWLFETTIGRVRRRRLRTVPAALSRIESSV